ncbi:MAG: DEAD/DEAH box helicase, partial [Methanomicrobiales archaeon]
MNLLDEERGFASPIVRNLFQARSGFFVRVPSQTKSTIVIDGERELLGALLHKIAYRGIPAPCSLNVERYVLENARLSGILDYKEISTTGSIEFNIVPKIENLKEILKSGCIREFLYDDETTDDLLERYMASCDSEAERDFFLQLTKRFQAKDKRLGLLFIPQRTFSSMGLNGHHEECIDFVIEIPYIEENKWLKIAVEIDGPTHNDPSQKSKDNNRDEDLFKKGWTSIRFSLQSQENRDNKFEELEDLIATAIPDKIFKAVRCFHSLSVIQQCAIRQLLDLPEAEAHIAALAARYLNQTTLTRLTIASDETTKLSPAIRAVRDTLDTLSMLHSIDPEKGLRISESDKINPDIRYFYRQSPLFWNSLENEGTALLGPFPISSEFLEPLINAPSHAVDISSSVRQDMVTESLEHILQNFFRKERFREGQIEITQRALTLKSVVGLLPTAAGKSLCYQLAGMLQPGYVLIVDPLRSLMIDQKNNLESLGLHRCQAFMSGLGDFTTSDKEIREEGYEKFNAGHYTYIFSSPERLQIPDFIKLINKNIANIP